MPLPYWFVILVQQNEQSYADTGDSFLLYLNSVSWKKVAYTL